MWRNTGLRQEHVEEQVCQRGHCTRCAVRAPVNEKPQHGSVAGLIVRRRRLWLDFEVASTCQPLCSKPR